MRRLNYTPSAEALAAIDACEHHRAHEVGWAVFTAALVGVGVIAWAFAPIYVAWVAWSITIVSGLVADYHGGRRRASERALGL